MGDLRSWLGLPSPSPNNPSAASSSASSSSSAKPRRSSSLIKGTPYSMMKKRSFDGASPPLSTPGSEKQLRHSWGSLRSSSSSSFNHGVIDLVNGSTSAKEKASSTKQVEVHQPYTGRFVWPAQDFARWPGSGDFAFDSIRRAKGMDRPKSSFGQMLMRVWNSSAGLQILDQFRKPLNRFFDDPSSLETLALLYYKRRSRWTRLDKLAGANEVEIRQLITMGAVKQFVRQETRQDILRVCYALLTVDELRDVLNCGPFLKDTLVGKAVEKHPQIYDEMCKLTDGGIFALEPHVHQLLLRLHQFTFSACDFEPEDAAEYINSGVLGHIPFLGENNVRPDFESCKAHRRDCFGDLERTLEEMGTMAQAMFLQQSPEVLKSLHTASTILMDQRNTSDGCCCKCWMAKRAEDNCLRMINLGVALLERERRYEDALHYLRITLQTLEQRCILDIDDPNPDTRISFHRARLMNRFCVDLGHLDRKNEALEELEKMLLEPNGFLWEMGSERKSHTLNRIGGQGMGLILLFLRLSEPPRRWKPKIPIVVVELPVERICVKRIEGKSVEVMALDHFLTSPEKKWSSGQHCENGIVHTLFGLLLCSENKPRRVCFDDFVVSDDPREIAKLLYRVENGEAPTIIRDGWTRRYGSQIRGVNWTRNTIEELELIAKNLGGKVLAMICRLFLDAYEAWCGGVADLLLWNECEAKFVEIKGPGDSLSDRQIAWGEKLVSCGANACVCYVTWQQSDSPPGTVSSMVFSDRQDSMRSERTDRVSPSLQEAIFIADGDTDEE